MAFTEETDGTTGMAQEKTQWLMTTIYAMAEHARLNYGWASGDSAPVEETDSTTSMTEES